MTRALYAWLFDTLDSCVAVRSQLDTVKGLRRMDRPENAQFQRVLTFGRLIRAPVPTHPHRPIEDQTVQFSIWVRPEDPDPGDLVLEDIQDRVLRILVWSKRPPIVNQDCAGERPKIIIMDATHIGDDIEPHFDDELEAWTKSFRITFRVNLATCQPALEWCVTCPEE